MAAVRHTCYIQVHPCHMWPQLSHSRCRSPYGQATANSSNFGWVGEVKNKSRTNTQPSLPTQTHRPKPNVRHCSSSSSSQLTVCNVCKRYKFYKVPKRKAYYSQHQQNHDSHLPRLTLQRQQKTVHQGNKYSVSISEVWLAHPQTLMSEGADTSVYLDNWRRALPLGHRPC